MLNIEVRDEDQNLVAEALIMCAPAVIPPPADTILDGGILRCQLW